MNAIPHGMPCPVCKVPLTMSERQGVEIDYCPQCRGVWLDRGELDKIIERAAVPPATAPVAAPPLQQAMPQQTMSPWGGHPTQHGYYKPKRHKSFLEELFD